MALMFFNRTIATMALAAFLIACSDTGPPASTEQLAAELTRRVESVTLAEASNGVIPRFNQSKTIGCVNAEFTVHDDLPDELEHGLFAQPGSHPALLRFANASKADDSEKDIRGLSIKVSEVEGDVLWGEPGVQDFLFNSHPALFVATPEDFLAFARARDGGSLLRFFANPFDPHLKSLWIVLRARARHMSPFDIRYWSTVPFAHGDAPERAVKYSLTPCSTHLTREVVAAGEHQLRAAMKSHLSIESACFDFGVQEQIDPESMPIEDASVVWDEKASPFRTVATLIIPDQTFDDDNALQTCEAVAFNPWQSLPDHEPLGRMNAVRKAVYADAAKLRSRR